MRNTIFISHANPEDNQFTEWLFSQLTLAGYNCWCDLEGLYGGERDFSEEIQKVIENETCKFLLVLSKSTFTKEFVKDEFEFARSISKSTGLKDFINPIKIDDVNFNVRIGLNRYNHFIFEKSWTTGLHKLLRKFNFDEMPRSQEKSSEILSSWARNNYTLSSGIISKECTYFSNWWEIASLPENIYIFTYLNETQAQAILEEDDLYPKIRHGNSVVAFEQNITSQCTKRDNIIIHPEITLVLSIHAILVGYVKEDFPTYYDAQNFLKRLLKKSLTNAMFLHGLSRYKMAGNQDCFFYRKNNINAVKVHASFGQRVTRRTLFGRFGEANWHFGVSFKVLLDPFICFSLKSHLIFTSDGYKLWDDDALMLSARRKKGKNMFNKEWRDLLMAMLHSLRSNEGIIQLVYTSNQGVLMNTETIQFHSQVDYIEPTKKGRIGLLSEDFDDEEMEEFIQVEVEDNTENEE